MILLRHLSKEMLSIHDLMYLDNFKVGISLNRFVTLTTHMQKNADSLIQEERGIYYVYYCTPKRIF